MPTKVVLDGSLFSECEKMGSNRHGMLRLAEDITKNILENKELEVSFANTVYTSEYDKFLRKYISDNYPSYKNKILSKKPFFVSDIPKWRVLLQQLSARFSLEVSIPDLENNDIFHSYYRPFPKSVQDKKIKKSITFLDIIPLRLGGYSSALIDQTKNIVESVVSNFAIAISEYSKQDLIEYDKRIAPERVFVAPLAASTELFFQNKSNEKWEFVKNKYNLPDNYFLSVSSNDSRKNIPHLIKSFSKFVLQQKLEDLFLVLTGNFNYSHSILDELKIDKKAKEKIFITERHIDDQDLSVIYSNSLCFFFMSLYEGFGLPVLEAMQCGTPVVASNVTSLPEVVGEAGVMLPPADEDALCEVMNKMYLSEELRNKFSKLGLVRAKQFSWQRCANEYAEIFKKIVLNF